MTNPITVADLRKRYNLTAQEFSALRRHNPGFPQEIGWVYIEYVRDGTTYKWKQKAPTYPEKQAVKWMELAIKAKGKPMCEKAALVQADRFDNAAVRAFLAMPSELRPRMASSGGATVTVRTEGDWW